MHLLQRIFANRMYKCICRNTVYDLLPGLAIIVRPIDPWRHVVEPMAIHSRVSRSRLEVSCIDQANLAPVTEPRRRYVIPCRSPIAGEVNHSGIAAGPYDIAVER